MPVPNQGRSRLRRQKITITLEGLESEDGHVRLTDFLKFLELGQKTLAAFDRLVAKGRRASYFRITNLSHGSPATIEIEPRASDPNRDLTRPLVEHYTSTLKCISEGSIPTGLDVETLNHLRNMAAPVGKKVRSARISSDAYVVEFSERFAKTLEHTLQQIEYSEGSIEGAVERFNSHDRANVFYVYPMLGPSKVACRFPERLKQKAAEAVTKNVRVSGELSYLRGAPFPHAIAVRAIEIYPPESELPTMDDVRGIAPDITGDLLSEDFLRRERDAWED